MGNVIMIAVLVVAVLLGVRSSIQHFKGEGGCCGGGGDGKPKRKKLPKVLFTKTFRVEGMHCDHCKNRVEKGHPHRLLCRAGGGRRHHRRHREGGLHRHGAELNHHTKTGQTD